jgi:TRAP-type C4-dicarboxylate transport system substrate-binding protein
MKTKKTLALLLTVIMLCSVLTACTKSDEPATTDEPAAADTADNADASEGSDTGEEAGDLGEPVELTVICGFPETDYASEMLTYLCDSIEKASGGNITFKRYMGGTFCTIPEEFGYIASGAADIHLFLPDTQLNFSERTPSDRPGFFQ